jgi:hypothetical protein
LTAACRERALGQTPQAVTVVETQVVVVVAEATTVEEIKAATVAVVL